MVGQIHLFRSRSTYSSFQGYKIQWGGSKDQVEEVCSALHCNLRLRRSCCTPDELQFDLSWGLVLIYCTWLGFTGFYTWNGYLSYLEFITRYLYAHGIFGSSIGVGMVKNFGGAVFVCQEGVERVTGCISGWTLSIHSCTNIWEHPIKGSHPWSLVQSGRSVRGPWKWLMALFLGIVPFWLGSHEEASLASVIAWCVGKFLVLSMHIVSYKSPGPLDVSLSSSEWVEW